MLLPRVEGVGDLLGSCIHIQVEIHASKAAWYGLPVCALARLWSRGTTSGGLKARASVNALGYFSDLTACVDMKSETPA